MACLPVQIMTTTTMTMTTHQAMSIIGQPLTIKLNLPPFHHSTIIQATLQLQAGREIIVGMDQATPLDLDTPPATATMDTLQKIFME